MRVAFNGLTALRIMRAVRSRCLEGYSLGRCTSLVAPDPGEGRKRFTKSCFSSKVLGPLGQLLSGDDIEVAVPDQSARLQLSGTKCTVYEAKVQQDAFVQLVGTNSGVTILIPSPELLIVEMSRVMPLAYAALFGCELCGSFSRDPLDPHDGEVAFFVDPVINVARLASFVERYQGLAGVQTAREVLPYVMDNAWSPMEAVVAVMAALPMSDYGYELGPVRLNHRVPLDELAGTRGSRVPDMTLAGTEVGLNYDGRGHLDLDGIARAALAMTDGPGSSSSTKELEEALRSVREKYVDDRRRDRELIAADHPTLVVTYEDLVERGGLDRVMRQAIGVIEQISGMDLSLQKTLLRIRTFSRERQDLLWSCLPGKVGEEARKRLAQREARLACILGNLTTT